MLAGIIKVLSVNLILFLLKEIYNLSNVIYSNLQLLEPTLSVVDLLLDDLSVLLQRHLLVLVVVQLLLRLLQFKSNTIPFLLRLGFGLNKIESK